MNDERLIEELLRRAVRERNDAAGEALELHPLHRRQLQAEVARQFPATSDAPTAAASIPFWKLPLWRFGYALAALLVIAFIVFRLFFQSDRTEFQPIHELAQNSLDEAPLRVLNEPPPPNPPAVAPVAVALNDTEKTEAKPALATDTSSASRESAATAQTAPVAGGEFIIAAKSQAELSFAGATAVPPADSTLRPAPPASPSPAAPRPAPIALGRSAQAQPRKTDAEASPRILLAAATPTETSSATAGLTAGAAPAPTSVPTVTEAAPVEVHSVHSQSFVRFATAQQEKARDERLPQFPVPPLLQSFKVEQNGLNLRVIDADGSIYRGMFDEANTIYGQVSTRRTRDLAVANRNRFRSPSPKASAELTRREPVIYFYQVSGTNLTRKATLTFSWNFVSTNEVTLAAMPDYRPVIKDADFSKQISDFPELLHRSYLKGRVQFDDGRVTEINAAPVFTP